MSLGNSADAHDHLPLASTEGREEAASSFKLLHTLTDNHNSPPQQPVAVETTATAAAAAAASSDAGATAVAAVPLTQQQRIYDALSKQRVAQEEAAAARWGRAQASSSFAGEDYGSGTDSTTATLTTSDKLLCTSSMKPTSKDLFVFMHVPKVKEEIG